MVLIGSLVRQFRRGLLRLPDRPFHNGGAGLTALFLDFKGQFAVLQHHLDVAALDQATEEDFVSQGLLDVFLGGP